MKDNDKGVMETLGEYMTSIFDKDKNGIVTIKELMDVFPNSAVMIAVIFVDLLLLVAEYRVWNFGYYVTGNPYKAIGFVLVSAIPFYLGQVFWLYPLATGIQKFIAVGFMGVALYVSWTFGVADLTLEYDAKAIAQLINSLTAGYIVSALIFVVIDPVIKANRTKKEAKHKANFQSEINKIARDILVSLRGTLSEKQSIEREFGANEVAKAIEQLRGNRQARPQQAPIREPAMASETRPVKIDDSPNASSGQKPPHNQE